MNLELAMETHQGVKEEEDEPVYLNLNPLPHSPPSFIVPPTCTANAFSLPLPTRTPNDIHKIFNTHDLRDVA
ncbi:unnamed protein product [Sphenostylis stenocarpa]|uniref:Uncharacterized protein n=1 Tax=Sphenostylis stenocarpa TaxID=92480 RepID=A0AA86SGD8_9FABA|nr:unnamed protein product [Sphenostylis stenocarpa]